MKRASAKGHNPNGPPRNNCHIREWTEEFKLYLNKHFKIIGSFKGEIQNLVKHL